MLLTEKYQQIADINNRIASGLNKTANNTALTVLYGVMAKIAEKEPIWFEQCLGCDSKQAYKRRQGTAYTDDEMNYCVLCDDCQEKADEGWQAMWDEYYRGCL